MSKKIVITFLSFFLTHITFSQNQDLKVILQESVINKMFKAIGEIKGSSSYSFMLLDGTYNWSLINPQIKLHPNKADFVSDVKVEVSKNDYLIHVDGNVEICYEPTTNLIYIEITKAKFPLNLLVFGKLFHVLDVDLAKYFETPLTFEGPLSMGTEMLFGMPDNTTKKIYVHPKNCGVKIDEKLITVGAELEFINKEQSLQKKK